MKKHTLKFEDRLNIQERLNFETIHEYHQKNPLIKWVILVFTIISLFLSLLNLRLVGVLISLIVSIASYMLSPKADKIIREMTKN